MNHCNSVATEIYETALEVYFSLALLAPADYQFACFFYDKRILATLANKRDNFSDLFVRQQLVVAHLFAAADCLATVDVCGTVFQIYDGNPSFLVKEYYVFRLEAFQNAVFVLLVDISVSALQYKQPVYLISGYRSHLFDREISVRVELVVGPLH